MKREQERPISTALTTEPRLPVKSQSPHTLSYTDWTESRLSGRCTGLTVTDPEFDSQCKSVFKIHDLSSSLMPEPSIKLLYTSPGELRIVSSLQIYTCRQQLNF